jgi:hypothetical protein
VALNDAAVYIPGTGKVYVAPPETVRPVDLAAPTTPWDELGHTSREDGLTITRDGGDSEVIGTWQNPSLRERRDPTTFAITMYLQQIDNTSLGMYFGGGDETVDGEFGVNVIGTTQENALYVRIIDGANEVGLYVPKVSIAAEDDVEVDVEGFLSLPIRCTVLGVTGESLMTFLAAHLGTPTP